MFHFLSFIDFISLPFSYVLPRQVGGALGMLDRLVDLIVPFAAATRSLETGVERAREFGCERKMRALEGLRNLKNLEKLVFSF